MPSQKPCLTIKHGSTIGSGLTHRESARALSVYTQYIDELYRRCPDAVVIHLHVPTHDPKWLYPRISRGMNNVSRRAHGVSSIHTMGVEGHIVKYHDTAVDVMYIVNPNDVCTVTSGIMYVLDLLMVRNAQTSTIRTMSRTNIIKLVREWITTTTLHPRSMTRGKIHAAV
jgi:hypothetical protein